MKKYKVKSIREIEIDYINDLLIYHLRRYNLGKYKSLHRAIKSVRGRSKQIKEIDFTFDESIWLPENPEDYNNLIKIQLVLHGRPDVSIIEYKLNDLEVDK